MSKENIFKRLELKDVKDDSDSLASEGVCYISAQNFPFVIKYIMAMLRGNKNIAHTFRYYISHFIFEFVSSKKSNIFPGSLDINRSDLEILDNTNNLFYSHSDLNVKLTWERNPKLPALNLDEISIQAISLKNVSEKSIDKYKTKLMEQLGTIGDCEEPTAKGDHIVMEWELDGETSEFPVVLGVNPKFNDDLEAKLIGLKLNQTIEHDFKIQDVINQLKKENANLPKIKELKSLQKDTETITCKISVVKHQRLNKATIEEVVKQLGCESQEELNSKIEKEIQAAVDNQNQYFCREQVNLFLEKYDFMVPKTYIKANANIILNSFLTKIGAQQHVNSKEAEAFVLTKLAENGHEFAKYEDFLAKVNDISRQVCIRMYMTRQILPALKIEDATNKIIQKYSYLFKNSKNTKDTFNYAHDLFTFNELFQYLDKNNKVEHMPFTDIDDGFKYVAEWIKTNSSSKSYLQ